MMVEAECTECGQPVAATVSDGPVQVQMDPARVTAGATARHTEWLTFGTDEGGEGVETFDNEAAAQRAADWWRRLGMTNVYVERHDVTTTRTVSTTTRTTDWKADER